MQQTLLSVSDGDITKRVVLAAEDSPLGYEGLFLIPYVPKPLQHTLFLTVAFSVHDSAVAKANVCMCRPLKKLQERQSTI